MSAHDGVRLEPILAPLCQGRPRLLRAEVVRLRGQPMGRQVAHVVLSFDAGQLWIRAAQDQAELVCSVDAPPPDLATEVAAEEEPWWRVMGAPLVAAWAVVGAPGKAAELALQFREDAANPRIVSITHRPPGVTLRCEPKPAWSARLANAAPAPPPETAS